MRQRTISLDADLMDQIDQIVKQTERRINHLETTAIGLDIPSINELRYALNHLLRYLNNDESGGKDVLKHARRALYDCYETESLFLLDVFQTFETDYSTFPIQRFIPDYMAWARQSDELQEFMQATPRDNRENYYQQLEALLEKLRPVKSSLRAARQEINKEILELQKKEIESRRTLQIALWSAGATVTAAIVAAIALMK